MGQRLVPLVVPGVVLFAASGIVLFGAHPGRCSLGISMAPLTAACRGWPLVLQVPDRYGAARGPP